MACPIIHGRQLGLFAALFFILTTCSFIWPGAAAQAYFFKNKTAELSLPEPVSATTIHNFSAGAYNHAATLAADDEHLYVAWYAGAAEHVPDVDIMLSVGTLKNGSWSFTQPKAVMTRRKLENSENRLRHTLGNPILYVHNDRLWLFFVSTTGGWATSSISEMVSEDGGKTWSEPHMLFTTAFLNYSTLTRGNPVPLQNGLFAIPFYNEFITKSGRYVVFNGQGEVVDVRRMSWNGFTLQPVVVPVGPQKAWAFFRRSGNKIPKVYQAKTTDGGKTWSAAVPTTRNNPDSGISVFKTREHLGLLYNNEKTGRSNLTLATAPRPYSGQWQNRYILSQSDKRKVSYPYTLEYKGNIYIAYSAASNAAIRLVQLEGEQK